MIAGRKGVSENKSFADVYWGLWSRMRTSREGAKLQKVFFPKHYYSQEMLSPRFNSGLMKRPALAKPEILRRLHKNVGVDGRFLSLPIEAYPKLRGWGEANDHWIRTAQDSDTARSAVR